MGFKMQGPLSPLVYKPLPMFGLLANEYCMNPKDKVLELLYSVIGR